MRLTLILIAAAVIFTVFTTVFAASAPKREVRVLPKAAWVSLCLLTAPVGGILYLIFGRPVGPKPNTDARPGTTLAPDDDPNFLRNLARKLREEGEGK
jgi:Phospholipase_D-nuclease N-terminal